MTQKYKKTIPPQFKTAFFPVSPMFHNPIYRISPMFYNPIYRISPVFFGLSMGATCLALQKKWAPSVMRSPIRVMWKTLVVFGDRD